MKTKRLKDPEAGRRGKHAGWADQMRKRPGRWHTPQDSVWESDASKIRRGRHPAFPLGDFEVEFIGYPGQGTAQRRGALRIRFIGKP